MPPPCRQLANYINDGNNDDDNMITGLRCAFVTCSNNISFIPRTRFHSLSSFSSSSFTSQNSRPCLHSIQQQRRLKTTKMTTTDTNSSTTSPSPLPPQREIGIVSADLRTEMTKSYMEYAMSVILGRAMPDVRDGLKPVHRRLLYAMYKLKLPPTLPFRKSARVVGEVLGKYHPHGDTAVYDALVRLAQPFSMSIPLIEGHGNFGSTDGDPAAAMRYTECRLSPASYNGLLDDLSADGIVEMYDNFDGNEIEPAVLPAKYPNLLVNGSSGIAVGMATNIPPHNLNEIIKAVLEIIENNDVTDENLMEIIKAPDFPTGGVIVGTADAKEVYKTGRGRIIVRACVHREYIHVDGSTSKVSDIEDQERNTMKSKKKTKKQNVANKGKEIKREALIVTELPYQVNKSMLVAKIASLVNERKLEGIIDLRDESDRTGTRVVIELKRDAKVPIVLQNLFKKTSLQTSFSANMMALIDGGRFPIRLTLRQFLQNFLDFRRDTVRKRITYDLNIAQDRLHIVEGFAVILKDIDLAVKTIRAASDSANAKLDLMNAFNLSEKQASAVLEMQLRRLTSLESTKVENEYSELVGRVKNLTEVLSNRQLIDDIIVSELKEISVKYGIPRRSTILRRRKKRVPNPDGTFNEDEDEFDDERHDGGVDDIDEMSLIPNIQNVITVTKHGYIKRMSTSLFVSQNRNTRGKRGIGRLQRGDTITHLFTCMTHDALIAVSADGVAYRLDAHKVPSGGPVSRGVPLFKLIPSVDTGSKVDIAAVLAVGDATDRDFLILVSKRGFVKRVKVSEIVKGNRGGKKVVNLEDGDKLRFAKRGKEGDSVVMAAGSGKVLRFIADGGGLRSSGRYSRGVFSMNLGPGDWLADMDVVSSEEEEDIGDDLYIAMISKKGKGKLVRSSAFKAKGRRCMGNIGMRIDDFTNTKNDDGDYVGAMQTCRKGDSIMLVASDGTIVRTKVEKLPVRSRTARGIPVQKLGNDVTVAAVAVVRADVLGEEDEDEDDDDVDDENDDDEIGDIDDEGDDVDGGEGDNQTRVN